MLRTGDFRGRKRLNPPIIRAFPPVCSKYDIGNVLPYAVSLEMYIGTCAVLRNASGHQSVMTVVRND
jgi:hypothetical protein